MCMVSAIINSMPNQQFPPVTNWPLPQAYDLRDVIRKLDELDKKLGAKDCHDGGQQALAPALSRSRDPQLDGDDDGKAELRTRRVLVHPHQMGFGRDQNAGEEKVGSKKTVEG